MEKKTQNKSSQSHPGSKIATGVGLAALAAAAAGAIYLYGTDSGKKRRKQISSWMLRMRADVIDQMSKMKDWSEESYSNLIDTVASKYANAKNIDKAELIALVADMKKHWRNLRRHVEGNSKPKKVRSTKQKSLPAGTDSK